MGRKKEKKKNKFFFKFLLILLILIALFFGSFMGYSITKNGGGMQGLVATLLGQDIQNLQKSKELDTINILLLRN